MKINKRALSIIGACFGTSILLTSATISLVSCSKTLTGKQIVYLSRPTFNKIHDIVLNAANNLTNNTEIEIEGEILNNLNSPNQFDNTIDSANILLNSNKQIKSISIYFKKNKFDFRKTKILKDGKLVDSIFNNFKGSSLSKGILKASFENPIDTNILDVSGNVKTTNVDFLKLNGLTKKINEQLKITPLNINQFNEQIKLKINEIENILSVNNISSIIAKSNSIIIKPDIGYVFEIINNKSNNNFYIDTSGSIVINNIDFQEPTFNVTNNESMLFNPIDATKARTLSVNVGMGDAEIIQVSGDNSYGGDDDFTILIDGGTGGAQGGKEASSPDGINAVASALNWMKVKDIDLFVVSHPHNDHMYGLSEIILNYATENSKALIGVDAWNEKANSSPTLVMKKVSAALEKENVETFDSVQIINAKNKDIIKGKWTPAKLVQFKNPNNQEEVGFFSVLGCTNNMNSNSMNAYSVSNMFSFNNHKELFAGDSEGDTDKQLMEYYNISYLDADIYKVSHHGSHTEGSNAINWIKCISPTYAIISAGAEDKYTLPDVQTLTNLLDANVKQQNILGTQPFGKSLVLANQTNGGDEKNIENWRNTNNFLNKHKQINNNNNGATIRANGTKTTGSFVDLNKVNSSNSSWTNVDAYYNMVMKGVGVLFDFSSSTLKLNEVNKNDINQEAWNPSEWENNNYTPIAPNNNTWQKLSSTNYKQSVGVPQIINIVLSTSQIGTKK